MCLKTYTKFNTPTFLSMCLLESGQFWAMINMGKILPTWSAKVSEHIKFLIMWVFLTTWIVPNAVAKIKHFKYCDTELKVVQVTVKEILAKSVSLCCSWGVYTILLTMRLMCCFVLYQEFKESDIISLDFPNKLLRFLY